MATIAGPTDIVAVGPWCNKDEEFRPDNADLQNACSDTVVTDSCPQNVTAKAHPAIRLAQFSSEEAFPGSQSTQSICTQDEQGNLDLKDALIDIAEKLASAVGSPCLSNNLVDVDPVAPDIQPECNVFDVENPRSENEIEKRIDSCGLNGGTLPCWVISGDNECGGGLRLDVCRGAGTQEENDAGCPQGDEIDVPDNTEVRSECLVEF